MYVSTTSDNPGQCMGGQGMGKYRGLGQTINLSTWTWEDWALLALGGVALYYLVDKGKTKATRALKRKRSSKSSSSGGSGLPFEIPMMLLILAGGGAALYFYSQSQAGATS